MALHSTVSRWFRRSAGRASACIAGLLTVLALSLTVPGGGARTVEAGSGAVGERAVTGMETNGAEATTCARCHAAIVASYARTAMARASGRALDGLVTGGFLHADSGVHYRVFAREGAAWLSFRREPAGGSGKQVELSGERQLLYYIGSNKRGRTYLYADALDPSVPGLQAHAADEATPMTARNHLWFEAPINWYAKRAVWDMAPAFEHSTSAPLALPVDNNCLHCHASAVADPLPLARNAYAGQPFAQTGISCNGCHGDARAHVVSGGKAAVLNPDKLAPVRRDSVCLQCHLEGDATVYRAGTSLAHFVPGDDIGSYASYFVNASSSATARRATSEYEALLRSSCKRASRDRLTCTTCHDPHSDPPPAERVAFFRAKCLACHTSPELATAHHPEQPDCALCHMPTRVASDISHEQMTDHDIERVPRRTASLPLLAASVELVPVGAWPVTDRERGLAYAQFAARGDRAAGERALPLLHAAEAVASASDAVLHEQLGFLLQRSGDGPGAAREYRATLLADPHDATAATNLAVLDAGTGHVREALLLLERVAAENPAQTTSLLDLAAIDCGIDRPAEAESTLKRALQFNPDDPTAARALRTGNYAGVPCRAPVK